MSICQAVVFKAAFDLNAVGIYRCGRLGVFSIDVLSIVSKINRRPLDCVLFGSCCNPECDLLIN